MVVATKLDPNGMILQEGQVTQNNQQVDNYIVGFRELRPSFFFKFRTPQKRRVVFFVKFLPLVWGIEYRSSESFFLVQAQSHHRKNCCKQYIYPFRQWKYIARFPSFFSLVSSCIFLGIQKNPSEQMFTKPDVWVT